MVKKTLLTLAALLFFMSSLYSQQWDRMGPGHGGIGVAPQYGPYGNREPGPVGPMRGPRTPKNGVIGRRGAPAITPDLENKILYKIGEISPFLKEKLIELKKNDPLRYNRVLHLLAVKYRWWQRLKNDPDGKKFADQLLNLSIKERELVVKYKLTNSESEKEKIRSKLEKIDTTLFDLRQKAREITVKKLEDRLNKIKKELKERKEHKREIIREHLDEILGSGGSWRW